LYTRTIRENNPNATNLYVRAKLLKDQMSIC